MLSLIGEVIDAGADPTDALWPACHAYQRAFPWRAEMIAFLLARGADPDRPLPSGESVRTLVHQNAQRLSPPILAMFSARS
jgi:hypothetical protein